MTVLWKRAKPGTLDLDTLITAPTLGDWCDEVLAALDTQQLTVAVTPDWTEKAFPAGLNFWFAVGSGDRARDAACYASEEANTFYCEILHADRRTQTLQPLLLSDYISLQIKQKWPSPDGRTQVPKIPVVHISESYSRIDKAQKKTLFRGAFFFLADAPIYWVDEEQYINPPLDEPNEGDKPLYYDTENILESGFTRIYYWHIPSEGIPSLKSFYVEYALTQRTGGGSLAMRVDPLSEVEWTCKVDSSTTGKARKFANQRANSIGLAHSAAAPRDYFQTNTPTPPLNAVSSIDATEPYAQYGGIKYYKRFKVDLQGTPLPRKNKPTNPGPPRIPDAMSLEISRLYRKKVKRKKLTKSAGARDDAGTVMAREIKKQMGERYYPFGGSKLSANTYVRSMFGSVPEFKEVDSTFRESWKTHSAGNSKTDERLPDEISQEWCHLHGHGDGGDEVYGNFVAGSKHCNTEQLAIELGQRIAPAGVLTARVTAYLFESRGHGNRANLTAEKLKAAISRLALRNNAKAALRLVDESLSLSAGAPAAPVTSTAAAMDVDSDPGRTPSGSTAGVGTRAPASQARGGQRRNAKRQHRPESTTDLNTERVHKQKIDIVEPIEQKIKDLLLPKPNKPTTRAACNLVIAALQSLYVPLPIARWMRYKIYHEGVKIFEHVYDGQSESFDANEGNILKLAVEHAVANKLGGEILIRYNARLAAQIAAHTPASGAAAPGGAASAANSRRNRA